MLPFLSHMNNPLLPKAIAEKLKLFYSPFTNYTDAENVGDKYVELLPAKKEDRENLTQYPDFLETYKSWDNFISAAGELNDAIEKWLGKYGSRDINFNTYLRSPHR